MLVLGIDPGIALTGYAVVSEATGEPRLVEGGVIRTRSSWSAGERLQAIYRGVLSLTEKHRPDAAAVEEVFFNRNVRTALAVGQARGVALLALADGDVPVYEYKPSEVKEAVTGYGMAEKHQVQRMVSFLLHLEEILSPDDAADAAAVAICHLQRLRFSRAVESRF